MIKRISIAFPEWCDQVMSGDEYAFIDTETTGFEGDIVELSIVDPEGNILYDSLLQPVCAIEPGAQAVHHISEAMVSAAPRLEEEWPEIARRIKGKKLIAWNAKFDAGRLRHAMRVRNIPAMEMEWYCAMLEYTKYGNFPKWVKLVEACQYQGLDFTQNHRALGDVLATIEVAKTVAIKYVAGKIWTKASKTKFIGPDLEPLDIRTTKMEARQQCASGSETGASIGAGISTGHKFAKGWQDWGDVEESLKG